MLATAIQQHTPSNIIGGGGFVGSGGGGGGSVTNNTNCFYAATAPLMPNANLPSSVNTTATLSTSPSLPPAAISPTFIEHKYSANSFKEKFFANLRQQNLNKIKSLKTSSSIKKIESDGNNEINSFRILDIVATNEIGIGCGNVINSNDVHGGSDGVDNDVNVGEGVNNNNNINNHQTDMCSTIQQQLSENVKHNLYKKTIN